MISAMCWSARDGHDPAAGSYSNTSIRSLRTCGDSYRQVHAAAKIALSMRQIDNCLGNAPIESFFDRLKAEHVPQRSCATRTDGRGDLFTCIEALNISRRLHSAIGC